MIILMTGFAFYVGVLLFCLYFCTIADPAESPIAEYLTETLPQEAWSACTRILGKKNAKVLEWISDRSLTLVYIVVVGGSWSVIFNYVYPWITSQGYVSQHHKTVGYFVFVACALSWRHASTANPGIITKKTLSLYDHFPYDDLMFVAGKKCPTRHIPRLARSKYDRYKYKQHVPRFDHFCGWVFNTIGEENYRWFLLFLTIHVGMCIYGTFVLCGLFHGHIVQKDLYSVTFFNRATGEEIAPGNLWFLAQYLFHKFFVESAVLVLMAVMSVALGGFLLYHIWITSVGLTTNETFKWDEIKKWHNAETKKYKQAVKDGLVVEGKAQAPAVSDGDVTCTPGQSQSTKESARTNSEEIQDPGPKPVNIYDRGFYENW
eukprot:CAMPEP_0168754908 /NCGR_PEP_ID=MMETSP0724-20121128/19761_1 /TAXON_ID=265536 /ORGANISM="Amphiprora sp., Strain CCMP467" /LENGTH=374 /DNA_ID=CAMNT_0008803437 /DNA_START=68 /DNA_END=1189 /DNA_ORIENTATION=+